MWSLFRADVLRYYSLQDPATMKIGWVKLFLSIFAPRLLPVFLIRLSHSCAQSKMSFLAKLVSSGNLILFGLEVSTRCSIGGGLIIPHTTGVVIGAREVGENVTIYQGVTLGALDLDIAYSPSKRPVIEDNVTIASGAKVLGGISVGRGSIIAANAVVVKDVPPSVVVGGVPAQIIRQADDA